MKYLTLLLLLSAPGWNWLSRVRTYNEALTQARAAYARGDAAEAARAFGQAVAAGRPGTAPAPGLLLNLAHAQAQAGQEAAARGTYGRLLAGASVPAALGSVARQQLAVLAAGQGQYAQAVSLLRQALVLNSTNATARYNYEVLRGFLARQPAPTLPPPAPDSPAPGSKRPESDKNKSQSNEKKPATRPRPASQPGADRPGESDNDQRPGPADNAPQPRPDTNGQPDPARPDTEPGATANGFRPGAGPARPLPTGPAGGARRGLTPDAPGTPAAAGRGGRPGNEPATDADQQLQTQRERLRQLNLTPGQARQLLEALRAQENQYLQQQTRPAGRQPKPSEPTW